MEFVLGESTVVSNTKEDTQLWRESKQTNKHIFSWRPFCDYFYWQSELSILIFSASNAGAHGSGYRGRRQGTYS